MTTKIYNEELQYEACAEYFQGFDLPHTTKTQILSTVGQAHENAEEKLTKYMSHGQPAIEFLQEFRVFDPRLGLSRFQVQSAE